MKKRIAAILCAAMLMMAMPTLAFAAGSNQNTNPAPATATAPDGSSVTGSVAFNGTVTIAVSGVQASNVVLTGSEVALASFEINAEGVSESNPLTLTLNAGSKYAGAKAKIFADHGANGTEVKDVTVGSDGSVVAQFTKNSVFTLVVDPSTATGATANKAATSPVTGLDMAGVAGVTAVAAIAAGCVVVALRKKVTE